MFARLNFLPIAIAIAIAGLGGAPALAAETTEAKPRYAIAVHGGAGGSPGPPESAEYKAKEAGMRKALALGRDLLAEGKSSIEVVEAVIRLLEDHPSFNAGKGAVLNAAGEAECDASIMDGRDLSCGGCAITRRTKNPITLARKVMEDGRHVLLSGEGADAFAAAHKLALVEPSYFVTPAQRDRLSRTQERAVKAEAKPEGGGTVGCVALDIHGNLAAGTSTGGRNNKLAGRVGDSPIIGAGTYADNRTCAVSGTGIGEEFIRRAAAYDVSAQMAYRGATLDAAVKDVLFGKMKPGFGGMIAVDRDGNISMQFNSSAMARGAADSGGRFDVAMAKE